MKPITESLENKILNVGGHVYNLSYLVRKLYQVVVEDDALPQMFDNSTEAKACADANGGEIIVNCITSTPKKVFWELWRENKAEIESQGIFVTKENGKFAITDIKPTRSQIVRSKGYSCHEYHAPEFDKHEMIDRDAERYGW